MQREARMYSLLRICRTSLLTMRASANQPVTPMTREMVISFCLPIRERIRSRESRTGTLCRSSTARIMAPSTVPEADPDRQPYVTPMRVMTAVLMTPMKMEALPPYQMME